MFKSARWRSEKNKITAVFRLQFHATQVTQIAADGLMISVIPSDVGKPTAKLQKAEVRDGNCYWENSVYETVKFLREPKTGKIHERIYQFVLSTGSSKAGLVGEVSIDFANYADAIKVSSVSLPIKNAKSEAVLHVSIQRMQENDDQREIEESDNAKINPTNRSLKSLLSNGEIDRGIKSSSSEEELFTKTNVHIVEKRPSTLSDIIMSSSDSSSGLDTPPEVAPKSTIVHQDHTTLLSSLIHDSVPQRPTPDASTTIFEDQQRSQWDWLGSSAPEISTDDSSSSPGDTLLRERSEEASEALIEKLKTELAVFARQAEVSDLELQTLRKQIVKESKKGQDLVREVVSLKEERDALKEECKNLKFCQKRTDEEKFRNKKQFEGGDPQTLLAELRQELEYEKDLNANLRIQLEKTQEANSELILAVNDLDEMLEQKNREITDLANRSSTFENASELHEIDSKGEHDDEEQKALEELIKEHSDAKDAHILEKKIMDLHGELEIYRRDKDELEIQMEQLALDYEILKQENHELSYKLEQSQVQEQLKMQYECSTTYATVNELENQIENLEIELMKQSKEFSNSLTTINELEIHVKTLQDELEKQAQGFEADLETLTRAKIGQEQRAIQAEEALRKTRQRNATTAERLQEEFKRLSVEMASTFEANEKLATKALTEANELRLQKSHLEERLQKAEESLKSGRYLYEAKFHELCSQLSSKTNQIKRLQSEIEDKAKQLECQKKFEEENVVLTQELLRLREEIERLKVEQNNLSGEAELRETLEAELKQMKTSMKENEMLIQRGTYERNELESTIALVKKEAAKTLEELNVMRGLMNEKESVVGNLQMELESLKARCDELTNSQFEDGLEIEKLRKQVIRLKSDLQKKEDAFCSLEKKLKDSKGRAAISDGAKADLRNKSAPVSRGSKEVTNLKERIKLLEAQIKLKENALENSTNSFLEKEKDLQHKIEELEERLEELHQNSMSFCSYEFQKVAEDATFTANGNMSALSLTKSDVGDVSEEEKKASSTNTSHQRNSDDLVSEIASLNEKNKSMEGELKEMQERYSEISLKFAEVEGERQQLVMSLRNLKNSKRT